MTLEVIAIIISLASAGFTGTLALFTRREQKLRLRPHVYVDKIDTVVAEEGIIWRLGMKNIGLLPAKKLKLSPIILFDGQSHGLEPGKGRSQGIIVPNQVVWYTMRVGKEPKQKVMEGKAKLAMDFVINYESGGKQYHWKAHYTYRSDTNTWEISEADAN